MKFKAIQNLTYSGILYNVGDIVEIYEDTVIERCKNLNLVEEYSEDTIEIKEDIKEDISEKTIKKNKK